MLSAATALRGMRARERWQRSELDVYRARELGKLRAFAGQHSRFYRDFHAGLSGRPLEELPVLPKPLLMERFDDVVTDRAIRRDLVEDHLRDLRGSERLLGRYWDNATSGSTGRPGPVRVRPQGMGNDAGVLCAGVPLGGPSGGADGPAADGADHLEDPVAQLGPDRQHARIVAAPGSGHPARRPGRAA